MAENGMRLIVIGARADLIRSGLPIQFWGDAILHFVDAYNCRFNSGVASGKTPYEEFHGRRPNLSMLRKFGTRVNVLVHHPENKFAPRTLSGIYVRMAMNYKAWRVWIPELEVYVVSRHVTFDLLPKEVSSHASTIDEWCRNAIKRIEDKKESEVYDASRNQRGAKTSKKFAPEHQIVVKPLPPAKDRKDLANKNLSKGTEGEHKGWTTFLRARLKEMAAAKYLDDGRRDNTQLYNERKSIISKEWKSLKKGKEPTPIPGLPPAQIFRERLPQPPAGFRQPRLHKPAPDEGGVALEASEEIESLSDDGGAALEASEEVESLSRAAEPEEPADEDPALEEDEEEDKPEAPPVSAREARAAARDERRAAEELQIHLTQAVINAIYVLEDVEGPIHQGQFSDLEWDIMMAVTGTVETPKTLQQGLNGNNSKQWRMAVQQELQSLLDLDVYEEITRDQVPKGKKILSSKIVLKYKEFERRFKARLVVLGFMQPDEDAGETFAPVAKFTSFRLLMAIACALNLDISSSDVKTAFLNAILEEAIYIYPPRGLGYPPNTVWKLLKNLYGLKGAPRGWNLTLHAVMLELGFVQSIFDPCLYFIKDLWVLVWVDDTLKVGTPEAIAWFEGELDKRFTMTHVADVEMFVGIEIKRDREAGVLELTQTSYIDKILEHHGMLDCAPKHTPMQENTKVSRDDCCQGNPDLVREYNEMGVNYPSGAAELLYLALCTRPDMAFVAKELCKVMSDPGPKHVPVLKYALKYAKQTRNLGLKFTRQGVLDSLRLDTVLFAWADSSFGDDPDTKRSTQGFVAKLCGAAVSWFSQGQKSTSLSTAEAELICLADALKEILYMRDAMRFFGVEQERPTVIYEDNQAVVATAHNPGKNHGKLKHVAIRANRVQEEVRLETIDVVYKETALMLADILTKALGKSQFTKLKLAILGYQELEDGH